MKVLGIDIGGTGIKGAVVDTRRGVLKTDRLRLLTPDEPSPEAVAEVVRTIARHFDWDGLIGCTFPGVVTHGVVRTAANLVPAWIDVDAHKLFAKATGCKVKVMNDADAAGVGEVRFGAPAAAKGTVVLVTLGTGIGSALLVDGRLVPDTEFGHLQFHGDSAERYAAESVREQQQLEWADWAARVGEYLVYLESLLWPDLFVLGGGVSKKSDRFIPLLECRTPVEPARLLNLAGIVGAAVMAEEKHDSGKDKKR